MKHEEQNCSIGGCDRIVISTMCFGRKTKKILEERVKVFSPYSERYLILFREKCLDKYRLFAVWEVLNKKFFLEVIMLRIIFEVSGVCFFIIDTHNKIRLKNRLQER